VVLLYIVGIEYAAGTYFVGVESIMYFFVSIPALSSSRGTKAIPASCSCLKSHTYYIIVSPC